MKVVEELASDNAFNSMLVVPQLAAASCFTLIFMCILLNYLTGTSHYCQSCTFVATPNPCQQSMKVVEELDSDNAMNSVLVVPRLAAASCFTLIFTCISPISRHIHPIIVKNVHLRQPLPQSAGKYSV